MAALMLAAAAQPAAAAPSSTLDVALGNGRASAPGAPQGGPAMFTVRIAMAGGVKPPPIRSWSIDLPPDGEFGAPVFAVAPGICDRSSLETTGRCPDDARLGLGSEMLRVDFGALGTLIASSTLYRGARCTADAIGCIEWYMSESYTGIVMIRRAVVVRAGDHVRIGFDGIESPRILGIEPSSTELNVTFDRAAILGTQVPGGQANLPRNFIENPMACTTAGWTYASTLTFADGSSSSATTTVTCQPSPTPPDIAAPEVAITYPRQGQRVRARRFSQIAGTAADASGIERVEYALARIGGGGAARSGGAAGFGGAARLGTTARRSAKCRFLRRRRRLRKRSTSCSQPRYVTASGTTQWLGKVPRLLPPGRYFVLARAIDTQNNASPPQKRRFSVD